MENNQENIDSKDDDFMKDIKRKTLEMQTNQMFHKTTGGRIKESIIIISGIGSVFIYHNLGVNVVLSLIFGFITYIIVGIILDKIIGKFFRLDKQIDWLQNTPEGQKEMEGKGVTKEKLEDFKKEIGL